MGSEPNVDAARAAWYERLRVAGVNGRTVRLSASTLYPLMVDCEKLLGTFQGAAMPPQAAALAADLDLMVKGLPLRFD
jgi:hypothetical protein